jgi:hypothetical protein
LTDESGLIFEGLVLDISSGGLGLLFPDNHLPTWKDKYKVELELPGLKQPLINNVEVRWVDIIRPRICGTAFLSGIHPLEVIAIQDLLRDVD